MKKKFLIALALVLIVALILFLLFFSNRNYVQGIVFNEFDAELGGVKVYDNFGNVTFSDFEGKYSIPRVKNRQLINFEMEGYTPIHKVIDNNEEGVIFLSLKLKKLNDYVFVDQNRSNLIEELNIKLGFDANTFVNDKNEFPQKVKVSITYFDPRDSENIDIFPGSFETDINNTIMPIESFGFAKILVRDDAGNDLNIVNGKKVKIYFKKESNYPQRMDIWYFDDEKGLWVFKSETSKISYLKNKDYDSTNFYLAEIDTVGSWWNCDRLFEVSFLDVIFDEDFTKSNWRLLIDLAGIFYEPIDWIHNTYILANPHATKLEKFFAVIAFLPFINASTGRAITDFLSEKILKGIPLNFQNALKNTVISSLSKTSVEKALEKGGKLYGNLLLVNKGDGIYEAHIVAGIGNLGKIKSEMLADADFLKSVKGIYGVTKSKIGDRLFNQTKNILSSSGVLSASELSNIAMKITPTNPSEFHNASYFLGEMAHVFPSGGAWKRFELVMDPSVQQKLSNKVFMSDLMPRVAGRSLSAELKIVSRDVSGENIFSSGDSTKYQLNDEGLIERIITNQGEVSFQYNSEGNITKEKGLDYELNFDYSKNGNIITKTLKSLITDETFSEIYEYSPEVNTISITKANNEVVKTYFDEQNQVSRILIDSSKNYNTENALQNFYDITDSGYSAKINIKDELKKELGYSQILNKNYFDNKENAQINEIEIMGYDNALEYPNMVIKQTVTFNQLGFPYIIKEDYFYKKNNNQKQFFSNELNYIYNDKLIEKVMVVQKDFDTNDEKEYVLEFDEVEDFSMNNNFLSINNNSINIQNNIFENEEENNFLKNFNFNYLSNGHIKKLLVNNQYNIENKNNFGEGINIVQISDEKVEDYKNKFLEFLSKVKETSKLLKLEVNGSNYNYKNTKYFPIGTERLENVRVKYDSESELSIYIGDTLIKSEKVVTDKNNSKKNIFIGRLAVSAIKVKIGVGNQIKNRLKGFLTFMSADKKITKKYVTIEPNAKNEFYLIIPSNTGGKLYFKSIDVSTKMLDVPSIGRFEIFDLSEEIMIDTTHSNKNNVTIVFDISGSMDDPTKDSTKTKLETTKDSIINLLSSFRGEEFQIIRFCGKQEILCKKEGNLVWEKISDNLIKISNCELTFNSNDLNEVIPKIRGVKSDYSTNIIAALKISLELNENIINPNKRIVFITDGEGILVTDANKLIEKGALKTPIYFVGVYSEENEKTSGLGDFSKTLDSIYYAISGQEGIREIIQYMVTVN